MNKRDLLGATVVVTGASSGIGRATALTFAEHGTQLVLAARRRGPLEETAAECERLGARALAVPTDVTDAAAVAHLAQAAERFGGRIDVWVNNAGLGAIGEFAATPIDAHDQVIRVNLLGYLHGAHAVLPYFKRQQNGVLINNLSLGAWTPQPYAAAYTASKFGLHGFVQALRTEVCRWPSIHVCAVYPAFIDTPAFQRVANYTGRAIKPPPPVYDPYQVAEAIVDLAQQPKASVTVGGVATLIRFMHFCFPGLTQWTIARALEAYLQRAEPTPVTNGTLFATSALDGKVHGGWQASSAMRGTAIATALLLAGVTAGFYVLGRSGKI